MYIIVQHVVNSITIFLVVVSAGVMVMAPAVFQVTVTRMLAEGLVMLVAVVAWRRSGSARSSYSML